ncbi:hypothetical protein IAQ61_000190 [Plenodomus lingam]|uniref:Essential protein Yae1 N-terminal domain-containing protein n=1 Tax=Leptosphaeria maculans (strain JN3 / isolate v23.1.3 / race Av1-4-5-6-7-8) TaxID=985895 RepID=E5R4L9_LEPMJ|nr:hypothetical protein LEMA_P046930.1 [Plenodomus lingam JN3]KAH9881465.1 hypothetical protein IAQ61_000190 [Plenodomus lingam]CBX91987.1 hypothetical protein LEMA_P046930.1 [Plenodomus lingam JN3]
MAPSTTTQPPQEDPFDSLLTLEDTLYTTAYSLGASDGAHAGRIEGRIFGLEKGFEKFTELGSLHGRSIVWGSRLPNLRQTTPQAAPIAQSTTDQDTTAKPCQLPELPVNSRLRNNVMLLHSLTDPPTFDTANNEEAVADFDDRVKRAGAKAKVVERIVGETAVGGKSSAASPVRMGKDGPVRVTGEGGRRVKKGDDSMEDFAGSRLAR